MTQPAPLPPDSHPYRPADDREEVYFDGCPSMWSALGQTLGVTILALVIAAAPFLASLAGQPLPGWTYVVAIVIALAILAIPFIRIRTLRYRISNYRIDYERGLLWKKIDTLELWHIDDISFSQGPLARLLGIGTIVIVSNDETTPRLTLHGLPKARPLFDALKQRVIAVKRQRGVIKMDIG